MPRINSAMASPNHAKRLKLALLALMLCLLVLLIFKEPPYNNIDNDQLQVMLDKNIPIYDVRRPEEWQKTGIIEDSKLLTFTDSNGQLKPNFLARFIAEVNKDSPVVLICRTGSRTSKLAHYLTKELGYTNIYNVNNGITSWIRENRPVIKIVIPTIETQFNFSDKFSFFQKLI